jgi:hypothetical protein
MNTIMRWMLVFVMVMVAAPAFAMEAVQMFRCEQEDEATEADLRAFAKDWLKAARQMKGGEQLELYLYFPIAVNVPGEIDFLFAIHAPSVEQWGAFWDGYSGSPAASADGGLEGKAVCPASALWEIQKVDPNP